MPPNFLRKNITIGGRRTSIGLEREFWLALDEICAREGLDLNRLCGRIDARRGGASRTSAVRKFVVAYLREAAGTAGGAAPIGVEEFLGNGSPGPDRGGVDQEPR